MAKGVKLRKSNRVITVAEEQADSYLNRGYDQIDEKGKVTKRSTGGRNVSVQEHNKVLDELEKLKEQKGEGGVAQADYDELVKENEALEADRDKYKEYATKAKDKIKELEGKNNQK